jgi:hypothetical protein
MNTSLFDAFAAYGEEKPAWPYNPKEHAIERLLEWGFAPDVIARVLGCSLSQIAAIRERRLDKSA